MIGLKGDNLETIQENLRVCKRSLPWHVLFPAVSAFPRNRVLPVGKGKRLPHYWRLLQMAQLRRLSQLSCGLPICRPQWNRKVKGQPDEQVLFLICIYRKDLFGQPWLDRIQKSHARRNTAHCIQSQKDESLQWWNLNYYITFIINNIDNI